MDTKQLLLIGGGAFALWWFFVREQEQDATAAPAGGSGAAAGGSGGGSGGAAPPVNTGVATPPVEQTAPPPKKVVVVIASVKDRIFDASGKASQLNADNWNYFYQQVTGKEPPAYEDIVPDNLKTANRGPSMTIDQYAGFMSNIGRGLTGGAFGNPFASALGGLSGLFPDYESWAV